MLTLERGARFPPATGDMMAVKDSVKTGISFGTTSGIITTLGLIVGLHAGTHARVVVIGGILTIAVADALSDALGIHISQESGNAHTKAVWEATAATFASKFLLALTFLVPVMLLPLPVAIWVSIGWGLALVAVLSWAITRPGEPAWPVILEHLGIAILVILLTHVVGEWVGATFR